MVVEARLRKKRKLAERREAKEAEDPEDQALKKKQDEIETLELVRSMVVPSEPSLLAGRKVPKRLKRLTLDSSIKSFFVNVEREPDLVKTTEVHDNWRHLLTAFHMSQLDFMNTVVRGSQYELGEIADLQPNDFADRCDKTMRLGSHFLGEVFSNFRHASNVRKQAMDLKREMEGREHALADHQRLFNQALEAKAELELKVKALEPEPGPKADETRWVQAELEESKAHLAEQESANAKLADQLVKAKRVGIEEFKGSREYERAFMKFGEALKDGFYKKLLILNPGVLIAFPSLKSPPRVEDYLDEKGNPLPNDDEEMALDELAEDPEVNPEEGPSAESKEHAAEDLEVEGQEGQ